VAVKRGKSIQNTYNVVFCFLILFQGLLRLYLFKLTQVDLFGDFYLKLKVAENFWKRNRVNLRISKLLLAFGKSVSRSLYLAVLTSLSKTDEIDFPMLLEFEVTPH